MDLIPLADRVLIAPDQPPDTTASGLAVVRDHNIPTSGRIVSVGSGTHPRKAEAFALAAKLDAHTKQVPVTTLVSKAARLLRELTGKEPDLAVGDRVVFSAYVGQELYINDRRYLVLRESDVLGVVETA